MTSISGGMLAVIPARGGSKDLPGKNIRPLAGRPLIDWTIAAALSARTVAHTIVSTDDPAIADAARAAGADIPFLRPAELATDTASSLAVLAHALEQCPGFATAVLLQPTSPLRTSADIDAAFDRMQAAGASSCVSVCPVAETPWLMHRIGADGRLTPLLPAPPDGLRRQELPPVYRLNGAIYICDVARFLTDGQLVGPDTVAHIMPAERSVDIDDAQDFAVAERLLRWAGADAVA